MVDPVDEHGNPVGLTVIYVRLSLDTLLADEALIKSLQEATALTESENPLHQRQRLPETTPPSGDGALGPTNKPASASHTKPEATEGRAFVWLAGDHEAPPGS